MTIGLVGRKCGMTRIFTDAGDSIPVTVVEALPNRVTRIMDAEGDGYRAVQVTVGAVKPSHVSKPAAGQFAKANAEPGEGLWEFRLGDGEQSELATGSQLSVELFQPGQMVDVTGVSKGKGFAGAVKRHHFHMQDATHGNSLSHRAPGSIGQNQSPGRVFKGKKMAGQMGNVNRTASNLEVVRVDVERNLILIKGGVPGAPGGRLIVRPAMKAKNSGGS